MPLTVTVWPKSEAPGEDSFTVHAVDRLSLINDETYGPAPIVHDVTASSASERVLYVNPSNIAAVLAVR